MAPAARPRPPQRLLILWSFHFQPAGTTTCAIAEATGNSGRVVAVEPDPAAMAWLAEEAGAELQELRDALC